MKKIIILIATVAFLFTACSSQEVKKEKKKATNKVVKKEELKSSKNVKSKRKKKKKVQVGSKSINKSEKNYHVIKTETERSFTEAEVLRVHPLYVKPGTLMSVSGFEFGETPAKISLGEIVIDEFLYWDNNVIWFVVPEGAKDGDRVRLGDVEAEFDIKLAPVDAIHVVWEVDTEKEQERVNKAYEKYELDEAPKLQTPMYIKGQWNKKNVGFGDYASNWDGGSRIPMYNVPETNIWTVETYFTMDNFRMFKRKIIYFAYEDGNMETRRLSTFESDAAYIIKREWGENDDINQSDSDPGITVSNKFKRYNQTTNDIYVNDTTLNPIKKKRKERAYVMEDNNFVEEGIIDNKFVIYQMMTRLFSNSNTNNKLYGTIDENGVGKFDNINDKALMELKKLGANYIWYTGVIEHATMTDYSKNGIAVDDSDVVKGRAGSPYAIKDYYDVSPDLAIDVDNRMQEFENLVKRTHDNGLKVMLDFVPNHVARTYNSDMTPDGVEAIGEKDDTSKAFAVNNNFYYITNKSLKVPKYNPLGDELAPMEDGMFIETPAKITGNDVFSSSPKVWDWFETIKLNYGIDIKDGNKTYFEPVPDTWIKMRDIVLYWTDKGVDGFRCDMAEMVPAEFWSWMITEVKAKHPDVIFVAEIYNTAEYKRFIEEGKFDFLYDKVGMYDTVRSLMQGVGNVATFEYMIGDLNGVSSHMLKFLENHDEQRIASKQFAGNMWNAVCGMTMATTMSTSPVMIYFGQEIGEPGSGVEGFGGADGRTTIFDYWGVPEHQKWINNGEFDGGQLSEEQKKLRDFYSRLLNLSTKNEAIRKGSFYEVAYANKRGLSEGWLTKKNYAYLRWFGDKRVLVVLNFSRKKETNTVVKIPEKAIQLLGMDADKTYIANEILWGDESVEFAVGDIMDTTNPKAGIKVELGTMSAKIYEIIEK